MRRPLLSDVGVLALVPDPFYGVWLSRHHVLTRLARYFRVVWLEPPLPWRDALRRRVPDRHGTTPPPPGLHVNREGEWLASFDRTPAINGLMEHFRYARARGWLRARGCERIVLYVWRPAFADALRRARYDFVLYHVVDEYTFATEEVAIPGEERTLLENADLVIVHSKGLLERKGSINPNTHRLPNGVDYALLSKPRPEPADLRDVPHPRLGYCGSLKNQLDWKLLSTLADRRRDWDFVFVGPRAPHPEIRPIIEALESCPNAHFLGLKPSADLAGYTQHFDVCVMPYALNSYTDQIYPLKLHEYLASGSPVVSTPIRTMRDFQGIVELAEGVEEWEAAVERCLLADPTALRARRRVAEAHDWSGIAYRVAEKIAAGLGPDYAARLDALPVPESWRRELPG
jgi:glycosyltransferase involved in cell wall biosynthesis